MSKLAQIDNFTQLFINNTPLIDTRAPIEFTQGAFPNSKNLPLMNNKERALIGTCYKNKGQQKAIELGHQLLQGDIKKVRIQHWLEFIKQHPNGALYCFRGGLRSQIVQQWIYTKSGIEYPRIKGGYKVLRRFLIDETTRIMDKITPIVIGGQTGSGKTLLLDKVTAKIDLEALANHRGSAFGNTTTPQPSQINFENSLAIQLIKQQQFSHLLFEDEGANIGTVHVPHSVKHKTLQADLILLESSLEIRLQVSMDAYVVNMLDDFIIQNNDYGFDLFANYWMESLQKIQKRLGLERHNVMQKQLIIALDKVKFQNDFEGFRPMIEQLLVNYYDPMYDYQINKKINRIVFKGNADEVLAYLGDQNMA